MSKILIDHRPCGGSGCRGCGNRGTALVEQRRPDWSRPADPAAFETARELCPCYEGFPINAEVSQCTHADRKDDGQWCSFEDCPVPTKDAA